MNEPNSFRVATAELIGFGTVATILDAAHEILLEIDNVMARDLEVIMNRVTRRFRAAEETLFEIGEV